MPSDLTRASLDRLLAWSPLQPAFRLWTRSQLKILAYHGVEDAAQFDRQMEYLKARYRPVSLEAVCGHGRLPEHAVLVTFDDGRRSVLSQGLPVLQRHQVPGVVFVVAGLIDGEAPYWWEEVDWLVARGGRCEASVEGPRLKAEMKRVPNRTRLEWLSQLRASVPEPHLRSRQLTREDLRQLVSAGVAVGNHSLTHPVFPLCSEERVEEEVLRAHHILTEALGRAPIAFAYPYGAVDERVEPLLARLGYELVFAFDHRVNPRSPVYRRLSRLRVDSTTSLTRFAITLSGLHPAIHSLRRAGTRSMVDYGVGS